MKYHYYTSNVVRHRRCERYIGDEGRDNRKSAAAGAKDGQFSGGFVTRESLHGGQWPHPSFVSRASFPSAPPGYLLPRLPRIHLFVCSSYWIFNYECIPRWLFMHGSSRYPTKRPAFPEVNWVGGPSLFLFISFSCTPRPTPRKCFGVRKVSERQSLYRLD